ncbi:hypothetical protein CROQUDRAFT_655589 [Cronartium quercuum f. sp. fusiforme G11]|uniref:Uncharacterized protein n=1 Tax=Cronartium quercuum f. sp. fusiforme G11 TaxID=708437 RepID=A0A9P6NPC4_9BASI|nr:hypothetical protein CROQUDRAFT_655589 [Cronartium quercuum f. sp. fusiforme G11]
MLKMIRKASGNFQSWKVAYTTSIFFFVPRASDRGPYHFYSYTFILLIIFLSLSLSLSSYKCPTDYC